MEHGFMDNDTGMTLDPPGTIAVVGAGPIGIEAALYGRFLGYDVKLFEAVGVASSWSDQRDDSLTVTPDQSLSKLAKAALDAQRDGDEPFVLPVTVGQWIDQHLNPLVQSDLLDGRLIEGRVTGIDFAPQEAPSDDADSDEGEEQVPPDFRLTMEGSRNGTPAENGTLDFEAIILTPSDISDIACTPALDAPYLFRIPAQKDGDDPSGLIQGRRTIVEIFASLAGRSDLDLYRPRRV